ncbi:MAG: sulfite exporter TauE/SafE family protein [Candidatus Buchananbacteria bacterium]
MEVKIKKISVSGMHCKSCELLIEDGLKKLPGVTKVRANQNRGTVEIYHHGSGPSSEQINSAIKNAGYEVGEKSKLPFFSKDKTDYKNLLIGAIIIAVLFVLLKSFGILNLSADTSGGGLIIALFVGLIAGVSTCMALVGGLTLGLASRHAELHPETTRIQRFRPHLFFNLGRMIGFAILGGLIGLIGTAFKISPNALGIVTMIVGAVMIFLGLKLVEIFPFLKNHSLTLPSSVSKLFGLNKTNNKEYSHLGSMITGALTFFLPCGFTQAMQIYAISTGSFLQGALIMFLFALGTTPGLLSIGGLTSIFKGKKARLFYATAGVAVILLGFFNIANGKNLMYFGEIANTNNPTNQEEQIVSMTQKSSGYSPNNFTVQKGKPVKWVINSEDPFSCASSLVMSKYGINVHLQKGENIVKFTPTQTGEVKFSCSMGMYTGRFTVVDESVNTNTNPSTSPSSAGGSSCGISANSSGGCGGGSGGCGGGSTSGGSCGGSSGGGCCGGGSKNLPTTVAPAPTSDTKSEVQIIKTSYTNDKDIVPNTFTVKKGIPVRFEIDVKENGSGCMSTIMIQNLYNRPQYLEAGKTIIMEFTPQQPGSYLITCAMNVPRGTIKVE